MCWHSTGERLLAAFVVLVLFGGVACVFPLAIWPFDPEQSITHYVVHAVWVASLRPLLVGRRITEPCATPEL